ncbi:thioesterase family protein [Anaeromyxobacter paludicola]|uniref:Thioesterase n=1 Tax=Anaeromyxobacter paludicola TaxID=2918171 RepID=A0ABM7XAK6_9BACT|nr:thioesterase family protein [Anaeromyxobacter paludicola]BDG08883.1 thioesterase [Anaeromyxobacter paludicola]
MKDTLRPGLRHTFSYVVPPSKTVPHVYPESPDFLEMPEVFATAFLVGLIEWTCMQALAPHLEPGEQSLGVHVDFSHDAATPPGLSVTVSVEVAAVEGRRVTFRTEAHDGVDTISRGTHVRFVIDGARFRKKVAEKAAAKG